jgi:hypothetical protein
MKRKTLSDYNSLKNQQKQSDLFKKYNRILKAKPTNLLKYYDYLTNKKPILDELNYLSNVQIANAKNEVAKQLENATILNDKFKANLEADKERAKLEMQQRKARQNEIFAKELFDANIRQEEAKKKEALNKLSNAFKRAPVRQDFSNAIGEQRFNAYVKKREEEKAKAIESLKLIKPPPSGMSKLVASRREEAEKKEVDRLNKEFKAKQDAERIISMKKEAEKEKERLKYIKSLEKMKRIPYKKTNT